MNKYEQYLAAQPVIELAVQTTSMRYYTRDEAIALAATLPGLRTSVAQRIHWLQAFPSNTRFIADSTGLSTVP